MSHGVPLASGFSLVTQVVSCRETKRLGSSGCVKQQLVMVLLILVDLPFDTRHKIKHLLSWLASPLGTPFACPISYLLPPKVMDRRKSSPQRFPHPDSRRQRICHLTWQRVLCSCMKLHHEMGRLSQIIWGIKSNDAPVMQVLKSRGYLWLPLETYANERGLQSHLGVLAFSLAVLLNLLCVVLCSNVLL